MALKTSSMYTHRSLRWECSLIIGQLIKTWSGMPLKKIMIITPSFPPHCRSSLPLYNSGNLNPLQQSKSSGNMQMQLAQHNRQVMHQLQQQRLLLSGSTHPLQLTSGLTIHQTSHMPLVNSPSSGNILHV